MSYNSSLPADVNVTVSTADIRENFRALKEDKIVDAATAVTADSAAKLSTPRTIALQGDATGSAIFDGSADMAISVSVLNSGVPVGTIIAWPSSTLPGGNDAGKWLECNGQSTEGYPELAAIVGDNVPDYQGVFLRGFGSQTFSQMNGSLNGVTSTTYSSSNLGAIQGDAIRNVTGKVELEAQASNLEEGAFTSYAFYSRGNLGANQGQQIPSGISMDASRIVPTANENRPINKAVLYLIKAKQ